jgi:hypothetical protein
MSGQGGDESVEKSFPAVQWLVASYMLHFSVRLQKDLSLAVQIVRGHDNASSIFHLIEDLGGGRGRGRSSKSSDTLAPCKRTIRHIRSLIGRLTTSHMHKPSQHHPIMAQRSSGAKDLERPGGPHRRVVES